MNGDLFDQPIVDPPSESVRRLVEDELRDALAPDTRRPTALEAGQESLARTAAKNEELLQALVPLARELALRAGPAGITVSNVRLLAVQRGILAGNEPLDCLGVLMKRAGLVPTGATRRSDLHVTHGIRQLVWRSP